VFTNGSFIFQTEIKLSLSKLSQMEFTSSQAYLTLLITANSEIEMIYFMINIKFDGI